MENRGQKRSEIDHDLPVEKRSCSSVESQPSTTQSQMQSSVSPSKETQDSDLETASSNSSSYQNEGETENHSSYDSDNSYQASHRGRSSGDQSKFGEVLSSLTGDPDESAQLVALSELCELLSFFTSGSLSGLLADSFSPLLVKLAKHESNPNIILLAIRAITYFCDVHPRSASYLVRHDAVPALCQRLMAIEYLDVAEQCVQALEKISHELPLACLQCGAIMAVLNYIDFFSPSVQRVALCTVVNICKKLPSDCQSHYMEAVPILCNLLQYEDLQLVESVATCLIRITDHVSDNPEMLDELCTHGMVQQATHLINLNSRTSLSQPVYLGLIAILVKLASGSMAAVRTLFELNISGILKDILSNYDMSHGFPLSSMVVGESNQVLEVLKLLNELLLVTVQEQDNKPWASEKTAFLTSKPDILQTFGTDLLRVLIQVVDSGVNLNVCYGCLSVISKLVSFSNLDMLIELQSPNISSFLAGVFTRKDNHVQILALQIVDSILRKHSDSFLIPFIKEGVLFAVNGLLSSEISNQLISDTAKDSVRCLCFSFETTKSVGASKNLTCRLEKDVVKKLAEHIKFSYFPSESCPEKGLSEIFLKLRDLSASLMDPVKISTNGSTAPHHEEKFDNLLQQLVSILVGKEPISTFEFIESGIVQSLLNYLSNGQYKDGKGHIEQYNELCIVEKNFEVLGKLLMSYSDSQLEGSPLRVLIQRLQSALSSVESFPVILSHTTKPRNSYVTVPSVRGTLYPSLRVKFAKEEGEEFLNDYSKDIVSVDPFSSLLAIEDHIWSKVRLNKTEHPNSQEEKGSSTSAPQACSCPTQDQSVDGNELDSMSVDVHEPMQVEEQEVHSSIVAGCPGCLSIAASSQKLFFSIDGQQLDHKMTLYQAIIHFKAADESIANSLIWNPVHKLTYRRAKTPAQQAVQCHRHGLDPSSLHRALKCWPCSSLFSGIFDSIFGITGSSCPNHDILSLLKCLESINYLGFHMISHSKMHAFAKRGNKMDSWDVVAFSVSQKEFVNIKLTEKLEQQLRDPLAVSVGATPYWCTQLMTFCPFLFGFEARCKYFRLAIQPRTYHNDGVTANERDGSNQRKKLLIDRNRILESATEMMRLSTNQQRATTMEIEYNEEVGTGLGPTLEFYTLVSHEFQKPGFGLWREDHMDVSSNKGVDVEDFRTLEAPLGFFPRPWSPIGKPNGAEFLKISQMFCLLGQFVAKALQDRRVLDIPFSKAFYKIILGKELSVYDIQSFDLELGKSLLEFICLIQKKRYLGGSGAGHDLCFQGSRIEDLFIEFIVPGYPDYTVDPSYESKTVNMSNLEEFVLFVIDATIKTGISRQIEAFKSGFDEVFPIKHLEVFTEEELEHLLCGEHDIWNSDELLNHIKFDHGYTASSLSALHLLEIIREFDREHQKLFLRFVTGAPSLPSGGLAALNPKLTIVRKHCSNGVDAELPSVMTCANYLKLPPYSTKELMKEKLVYALTEGQGSFHLS